MKSSISTSIAQKFKLICISLLLLVGTKTYACGPDFSGYYFTWLLEHYTYNNKFFMYQFDAENRFYSKSWHYDEEGTTPHDPAIYNLDLWRMYLALPKSIHDSDLKKFIYYNTDSNLAVIITQKKYSNPIANTINSKSNGSAIFTYLRFVNEYQEHFLPKIDAWNYDSYTNFATHEAVDNFAKRGEKLIANSKDAFLQWRILYTMLRAAHFNKHYDLAIQYYEMYYPKLPQENSLPQFWCEGIYSGALLKTGKQDKAIYYAARAFANCPDQYEQAVNTYLISNRDWKSALSFCKNAKDSVYVVLLEGANHVYPSMEYIQTVYNTNPASPELKLLWLRETNKIEHFVLNGMNANDGPVIFYDNELPVNIDTIYKDRNIVSDYVKLGEKILSGKENIPVKVTVANCLAYYYYSLKKYKEAQQCIEKISELPKDEIEQSQYLLLTNLIKLKKEKEFNTSEFMKLVEYFKHYSNTDFNQHIGHYLVYNELAPYYLSQKDTMTAFWAYTCANGFDADSFAIYSSEYSPEGWNSYNYATYLLTQYFKINDIEKLKTLFLTQKGENEMQSYFIKNTKIKDGIQLFDEVITKKYLLAEKWDLALPMLAKCPKAFTEIMGPNPANFKINDTIEETPTIKNNFSVKQIITLAQTLKTNAQNTSATFISDKLLYGTLLYNLSFYGRNHYVLDNHWNHYGSRNTAYYKTDSVTVHYHFEGEDFYNLPINKSYENYFYLTKAESYLKQALLQLTSNEDKAKCAFLLAKCWQKRCPMKWQMSKYGFMENVADYVGYSVSNPYFNELKKCNDTKLHQAIFNTCSYYAMFLKK